MPTPVLITVDTELSLALHQRGVDAGENFARSIAGRTGQGDFGVGWQMDRLEAHGLRGVYFVDPMPALAYGGQVIADVVAPILARGHDVQLHIHTEWLAFCDAQPVAARRGHSIGDFDLADQTTLIALARDLLVAAGAPEPVAFRAGNFGANDDTLRALATLGFAWDSSFNPCFLGQGCAIDLPPGQAAPIAHGGVVELPVSAIHDRPGQLRPAQICAMSATEMRALLVQAAGCDAPVTIVTHSFEMLSRDRQRPNHAVTARFEAMCRAIADNPALVSTTFADLDPDVAGALGAPRVAPSWPRTVLRMGEQALAHWRYERA